MKVCLGVADVGGHVVGQLVAGEMECDILSSFGGEDNIEVGLGIDYGVEQLAEAFVAIATIVVKHVLVELFLVLFKGGGVEQACQQVMESDGGTVVGCLGHVAHGSERDGTFVVEAFDHQLELFLIVVLAACQTNPKAETHNQKECFNGFICECMTEKGENIRVYISSYNYTYPSY